MHAVEVDLFDKEERTKDLIELLRDLEAPNLYSQEYDFRQDKPLRVEKLSRADDLESHGIVVNR